MRAQVPGLVPYLPQLQEESSEYTESSTSEFMRPYVATGEEMALLSRAFAREADDTVRDTKRFSRIICVV